MDAALATFQPSGMSSDFNEKSGRLCANSSTSLLSHSFWMCAWSQWPIENWWSHPVVFTCASRSINYSNPSLTSKGSSVEMSALWSGLVPPSVILSMNASMPSYASWIAWFWVRFYHFFPFSCHCILRFGHGWFFTLCVCGLYYRGCLRADMNCRLPAHILIPPCQYITFIILKEQLWNGDFSVFPMDTCMFSIKKKGKSLFQSCLFSFLLGIEEWGNSVNQKANVIAFSE